MAPETLVNFPRGAERQRPDDLDGLRRPLEQLPAGNEEVTTCHDGQFFRGKREYDRANSRPVDLARAHRTGLTTCIDNAPAELIRRHFLNRRRNQIRLGVSGGIPIGGDGISRCEHNCAIENQNGAEGVIAGLTGEARAVIDADEIPLDDLLHLANEAPVVRLVNLLLIEALDARASDVHLEAYQDGLRVRYRGERAS